MYPPNGLFAVPQNSLPTASTDCHSERLCLEPLAMTCESEESPAPRRDPFVALRAGSSLVSRRSAALGTDPLRACPEAPPEYILSLSKGTSRSTRRGDIANVPGLEETQFMPVCSIYAVPLSAISYQLSAISYQPSAISYQPSAISYQPSAISRQPCHHVRYRFISARPPRPLPG